MFDHTITLQVQQIIPHAGIVDVRLFTSRPCICLDCGESLTPGTPYGLIQTDRGNFHLCRRCTQALVAPATEGPESDN